MKVKNLRVRGMDLENKSGQMEMSMSDNGKMIKLLAKVS